VLTDLAQRMEREQSEKQKQLELAAAAFRQQQAGKMVEERRREDAARLQEVNPVLASRLGGAGAPANSSTQAPTTVTGVLGFADLVRAMRGAKAIPHAENRDWLPR
jgi:hypothetical protein